MVRRYLAAFGPATVRDVQAWSGLTRLREVIEPMRPSLRTFRDQDGRELFDLPGAPRPDPEVPAPARLVPEYDNLILSHDDRTRIMSEDNRKRLFSLLNVFPGTVLVGGFRPRHVAAEPVPGRGEPKQGSPKQGNPKQGNPKQGNTYRRAVRRSCPGTRPRRDHRRGHPGAGLRRPAGRALREVRFAPLVLRARVDRHDGLGREDQEGERLLEVQLHRSRRG